MMKTHEEFEESFCDALQTGPFEVFHQVEDCLVEMIN